MPCYNHEKYYRKGKIKTEGGSFIEIQYHNSKTKKLCQDYKKAKKELNVEVAEKLHSLINMLESVENLYDIHQMRSYNLHPLCGDREGQYALDLGRRLGYRLVIKPLDENGKVWNEKDINIIYKATKIIIAWEVTNHYE